MSLGEQIAVLDGLAAMDPNDGRIGQRRARVNQYARAVMPGVLSKRNMPSTDGANYGGGSSYYPGGALMPSSVGLAGIPGVLPPKMNVIDASGGANYSGGSSSYEGGPLLPSNAGLVGLAAALIQGGYGRAGLGASFIEGGYGRAGLGQTMSAVDEDLAAASEAVETARQLDPTDGRIGQYRARVDEYGQPIMSGVLDRSNVLDPSEGANYGGGSDYYAGSPLLPSSVGLAELRMYDGVDALPRIAGSAIVKSIKSQANSVINRLNSMSPQQKQQAKRTLTNLGTRLLQVRSLRRRAGQAMGIPVARIPRNFYAVRLPMWAQ